MIKASKIVIVLFFISINALTSMENSKKDILGVTIKIGKKGRQRKQSVLRFNDPTIPPAQKCFECKLGFKRGGKQHHMTSIHNAPSRIFQQQKQSKIVSCACEKCGKDFSRKAKAHALFHDETIADDLKCFPCELGYLYISGMKMHNDYHHESNYFCDLCDHRMLGNRADAHKLFHDVSIPDDQKCTEHRLGFSTKNRYNKHVNAHVVVALEEANAFVAAVLN